MMVKTSLEEDPDPDPFREEKVVEAKEWFQAAANPGASDACVAYVWQAAVEDAPPRTRLCQVRQRSPTESTSLSWIEQRLCIKRVMTRAPARTSRMTRH